MVIYYNNSFKSFDMELILTGKCKEDFENWYINVYLRNLPNNYYYVFISEFILLTPCMKYGVYVNFFDSVSIMIEDYGGWEGENKVFGYAIRTDKIYEEIDCKTRQEARTKAIEKANEIYNELKQ